jgi:hypothetical protein
LDADWIKCGARCVSYTFELTMYVAEVEINKEDYLACNRYYLKRYFGVKEIILLAILFVAGIVLYFVFEQIFMIIMSGVTLILTLAVVLLYLYTGRRQYLEEFVARSTHKWTITFDDDQYAIETHEKNGEQAFTEVRDYTQVDRIAIVKNAIYIYTSPATIYYLKKESMKIGEYEDLLIFIKEKFHPMKFKMKQKRSSQFPINPLGPKI